ncbi:MAG: alkaline phosphatase family protein [Anaerolineae bacterium]
MLPFFNRRNRVQRVLVLGLDCASPQLIFEQLTDDLPNLKRLMQAGTWGILRSSIPCITVPAWSSMTSSCDPGVLGVYGFRNRSAYDYHSLTVADSRAIKVKRLWEYMGEAGKQSLVLNVPQTYPVKPIDGHMVSGFMTPNTGAQFAYPAIFKQEVLKHVPDYQFDVRDFRHVDRAELYQRIVTMTHAQFQLLEYALIHKDWQFAMHVNIGLDRIHHAFWRYHDPQHRLHEADSPFASIVVDYYRLLDEKIGRILDVLDEDTAVLVVSDHGVKRMDGAVAINEWLWQNGWLALKSIPQGVMRFEHEMVDWANTRAWSTGGYYGRIFLNVAGREPQGVIALDDYETTRDELAQALQTITGDRGQMLSTSVFKPQMIYKTIHSIAPDLMVYFGDLHWRCVGSVGYDVHYTLENDTGPDDANHAEEGMFILYHPHQGGQGRVADRQLMDIAPTVLHLMHISVPKVMQGTVIEY